MTAERQYEDARRAIRTIELHAAASDVFLTHGQLTTLLGYNSETHSRHIGQVCSLIDAACFWAKLPFLAIEKIRLDDGTYNWNAHAARSEELKVLFIGNPVAREWTAAEFAKLLRILENMNGESAKLQWEKISALGPKAIERMKAGLRSFAPLTINRPRR